MKETADHDHVRVDCMFCTNIVQQCRCVDTNDNPKRRERTGMCGTCRDQFPRRSVT